MRNQLLKDSDAMSMVHGLELRVPFLDKNLLSTIAKIPPSLRLRPRKAMLLDAVPEIPEWVLNQPKRGFVFPYKKWLSGPWGSELEAAKGKLLTPRPTWYQIWACLMLNHWIKERGLA